MMKLYSLLRDIGLSNVEYSWNKDLYIFYVIPLFIMKNLKEYKEPIIFKII